MQMRRAGLFILIILSAAFAANVEPLDLQLVVPAAAVVVGIFLAIVSMLSKTISDPKLEAWTKSELREFAAGLILVTAVTAFVISSSGISAAMTGSTDPIGTATQKVDTWLNRYDVAYLNVIEAAGKIRTSATYAPSLNVPVWFISFSYTTNPLSGVAILMNTLNIAAQALTNAIFLSEAIRLMLVFCKAVMPKVILPLAFVLRLIPFTRRSGNTLIAVGVAGAVILPFAVILTDELNGTITMPEAQISDMSKLDANPWAMVASEPLCETIPVRLLLGLTDPGFSAFICMFAGPFFAICFEIVMNIVYPLINEIFQIIMTILIIIWEASLNEAKYGADVYDQLEPFMASVNNLVLLGYLDIILVATITIVGARSLSAALGGEAYMAGIQRLI